jgi:hypothetical protein
MRPLTRGQIVLLGALLLAGCATLPEIGPPAEVDDPQAGTLTIGRSYAVRIRYEDLRYTGSARYEWPDGRRYEGAWRDGRPDGRGVETRTDGGRYAGEWRAGERHGFGTLTHTDGSRYQGEFHEGQRVGAGILEGPAGRYSGEWHADLPHGRGRFEYADSSTYEGEWADGRRQGYGRFTRPGASSTYEGDWQNDLPHGFGRMSDRQGYSYDGRFASGRRNGYGVLDLGEGVGYAGMWRADRRFGFGRESRPDGSRYEGEWRDDRRHGTGIDQHPDGSFHEGAFEYGRPLGPGRRRSSEGTEIAGIWNGDAVTNGFLTLPDGGEFAGALYDVRQTRVAPPFLDWLEGQAASGSAQAALLLGDAHRLFEEPAPDPLAAARWYRFAAERGSADAAFRLAEVLASTDGVTDEVLALLTTAAGRGHGGAATRLGTLHQTGGPVARDPVAARSYYETGMRAGDLVARNNLAWLLATSPERDVRDGALALRLVRPLALLYDQWTYIDTLAAAYAELGDFESATAMQRRAIALAATEVSPETVAQMHARLSLYEGTPPRPFREH